MMVFLCLTIDALGLKYVEKLNCEGNYKINEVFKTCSCKSIMYSQTHWLYFKCENLEWNIQVMNSHKLAC